MPSVKQPQSLKVLCKSNLINNIELHWQKFKTDAQIEKSLDDPSTNFWKKMYLIGPFEQLNDETITLILKKLYQSSNFNRNYFCLCLHGRLRSVDCSFIKKKSFFNSLMCNYMGKHCINLTELNLSALSEITPKNLCSILNSMKNLKKLDLSHTKANQAVCKIIATNCQKLEYLNLENCKFFFDDCLDLLNSIQKPLFKFINIDNISLSDEKIQKSLEIFKNLKFFYVSELIDRIWKFYKNKNDDNNYQYGLETLYIDSDVLLKEHHMEALVFTCSRIKTLRINCIGKNECLKYLNGLNSLSELTIANPSLLTFKFGEYFLEFIKSSGMKLKHLTLMNLVDVNLQCIAKYCTNLIKLNVELIDYYEPCEDPDIQNNEQFFVKNLSHLSISNICTRSETIHLNIGMFKNHLIQLLGSGSLKFLHLAGLNELDEEFFQCLLSTPASAYSSNRLIHQSIETIELKEMNGIGPKLIINYLLTDEKNCLKEIVLIECKMISRQDSFKMKLLAKKYNLDCQVNWS